MRVSKPAGLAVAVAAVLVNFTMTAAPAGANDLTGFRLTQSTPVPSATANHTFALSSQDTATTIRCVRVTYSLNADGTGGAPTGFNAAGASFSGSFLSSWAGWATSNSTGVAKATLAGGATPAAGAGNEVVLTGVVNGSTAGTTYYATLATFTDLGCSTLADSGTTALIWTGSTNLSVVVEASFGFTVAGNNSGSCNGAPVTATSTTAGLVPLGRVNVGTNAVGSQLLSLDSNSVGGYTIYARTTGTGAMGPIPAWGGTNAVPTAWTGVGTKGFGYSTDHALSGGTPARFQTDKWAGLRSLNDEVAYEATGPVSSAGAAGQTKVCYKVGVDATVPAGSYNTTVIYTAVPVF